jgi:23S rRNA pseudouridine1911/1915/1917 synthase
MAVNEHGKEAITHYECDERYLGCARVSVKLETGRTHQIRVHMTHIGHSLVGDPDYGRRLAVLPRQVADVPAVADFTRQALHAHRLELIHPGSEEYMIFDAEIPDDMVYLMEELRLVADHASRNESNNDR